MPDAPKRRSARRPRTPPQNPGASVAPGDGSPDGAHAHEQLLRARIALLLGHPFIASATMRLPFRCVPNADWCPTMATDGHFIYFRPAWVARLRKAELVAVVAHEVLHCVLGHVERRGTRDRLRWNIATDYAINAMLAEQGFELPAGGLLDRRFAGMTAEQIHDALPATDEAMKRLARGFDVHLEPDDARTAGLRGDDAPDAEERAQIRRGLVDEMRGHLAGSAAATLEAELQRANRPPRLDWRTLLRRWLNERVQADWRTFPFSKRLIHRGLFLPSVGVEAPGRIVFAIDTSSSMPLAAIHQAFAEVESLRRTFPCELDLVQCDTAIRAVQHFDAHDPAALPTPLAVHGRGGTDFRPLFDWVQRMRRESGTCGPVIFVSDADGTFPPQRADFDLLWLVPKGSKEAVAAQWGAVIRMADPS